MTADTVAEVEVRAALDSLRRIEAEIAGWEARKAAERERLGLLIATHYPDARAVVPGYGTVVIRAPGVARVWDSGALGELAQSLRETGHAGIAAEIEACRRTQERAGGLAVKWETAEGGEG